MKKYGKSVTHLFKHKKSFFNENDQLLKHEQDISNLYIEQPLRTKCKNCSDTIDKPDFYKNQVPYTFCSNCGHLNGLHDDTNLFCNEVYKEDKGSSYAKNYSTKDINTYNQRMEDIYLPKVDFLKKSLEELNEIPESMSYVDFGAGAGYFVKALHESGMKNSIGYDVSDAQIDIGNRMIGMEVLYCHNLDDTLEMASNIDVDVLSMIGVLEHVQHPRKILKAI